MGDHNGPKWYFSRREIEENSPSRRDGIDLKKETRLRKSYCTFLQELGIQLKVPQMTIATAIVFCHRFYLYQSHGKNDTKTIATVCMFLAGKVEETPRPLKDFVLVSYGVIHKGDPAAVKKIKQKEVYEQQKELILLGERLVLTTLGFDLNVVHPYKPLIEAIKKFGITRDALVQIAWNFVNDGLRTTLCLQFKPHHVAAGAIFIATKFLDVELPTEGGRLWWQEFGVTPWQLEDISNQIMDLYQRKSTGLEGITGGRANHLATTTSTISENSMAAKFARNVGGDSVRSNDGRSSDAKSGVSDPNTDIEGKDCMVHGAELVSCRRVSTAESLSCCSISSIEQPIGDAVVNVVGRTVEASGRLSVASGADGETAAKEWSHPSRESTGSGWPEHPERDHKRRRFERGG